MRRTDLFCETLRQNPAEAEIAGHQLLLRGGYVQPLAAGIYSACCRWASGCGRRSSRSCARRWTPSAARRSSLPVVQPAELWQETGRWQSDRRRNWPASRTAPSATWCWR